MGESTPVTPMSLPADTPSTTYQFKLNGPEEDLFVIVGFKGGKPVQTLLKRGKVGVCDTAYLEAMGRMVSAALQHGAHPLYLAKQLAGIVCECNTRFGAGAPIQMAMSPADAVARALMLASEMERM